MSSSATIPGDAGSSDDFYDAAPLEPHLLHQGEILIDVPILNIQKPPNWQLLRTRSGKRFDEALQHDNLGGTVLVLDSNQSKEEWQKDKRGDFVAAMLDKNPVIVLNQTCDIQTKDTLQVAPIYPANAEPGYVERLMKGDIYSAFGLKERPPEIEKVSYVDFELIQAVHKSFLKRICAGQHFRLKPERVRELQRAITRYFGRPNSFDSRVDNAPATGTYLCLRCFYKHERLNSVPFDEGVPLKDCPLCGGMNWALKGFEGGASERWMSLSVAGCCHVMKVDEAIADLLDGAPQTVLCGG